MIDWLILIVQELAEDCLSLSDGGAGTGLEQEQAATELAAILRKEALEGLLYVHDKLAERWEVDWLIGLLFNWLNNGLIDKVCNRRIDWSMYWVLEGLLDERKKKLAEMWAEDK